MLDTAESALSEWERDGQGRPSRVRRHPAGSVLHNSACISGPPNDRCSIKHSNARHRADTEFTTTSSQSCLACAAGAQVRVRPCTGRQCWVGKQHPEQQHTVCALHAQALCSHCDRSRSGHSRWACGLVRHTSGYTHPPPTSTMCVCACLLPSQSSNAKNTSGRLARTAGESPRTSAQNCGPADSPLRLCAPYKRYRRPLSLRYAVSMMASMASTWWCVMVHVLAMRFFCSGSQAPPCSRLSISA